MNNIILSIIIPIKITFQNKFLLSRVSHLIKLFSHNIKVEVIIIDSSEKNNYANTLTNLCSSIDIIYYYLKMKDIYSAAKARNYGSKKAKGAYLLFYDADLLVKDDFLEKVLKDIGKLKVPRFTIYPCLYLSESKTKAIEDTSLENQIFEDIKEYYIEGFNDEVLYLAVNTSTILVNKEHFFAIGAYNENYKGHGYEDFELLHRLYMAYPIIERHEDYAIDYKTNFPAQYKGFRKYYAYYALENFFKGAYTMHLWHPRPLSGKYYRHRSTNQKYFLSQLNDSITEPLPSQYLDKSLPDDLNLYINNLLSSYGYDKEKYFGLSHLSPNNVTIKNKNNFQRKLRKLLLHPVQFFSDIRLK